MAATKNQTPGQELQPKEVIATNAQIREHMRQLNEDYKELERLFLKEKNKRKVCYSMRRRQRKVGCVMGKNLYMRECSFFCRH